MVTFNVRFNIAKGGHAFAVIGYKENISKNELLIEFLNPWHCGDYLENNIKKNKEYNNLDNKLKNLFDESMKICQQKQTLMTECRKVEDELTRKKRQREDEKLYSEQFDYYEKLFQNLASQRKK